MRRKLAFIVVVLLALGLAGQAFGGVPKVIPANTGRGRVGKGDIEFFREWEKNVDNADQELVKGVEAGSTGCKKIQGVPAAAKAGYKKAMAALTPTATAIGKLWGALEAEAQKLDKRTINAYADPRVEYIAGTAASNLGLAFFHRSTEGESALKSATEKLAKLDCDVSSDLTKYNKVRAEEEQLFGPAMESLETVFKKEP